MDLNKIVQIVLIVLMCMVFLLIVGLVVASLLHTNRRKSEKRQDGTMPPAPKNGGGRASTQYAPAPCADCRAIAQSFVNTRTTLEGLFAEQRRYLDDSIKKKEKELDAARNEIADLKSMMANKDGQLNTYAARIQKLEDEKRETENQLRDTENRLAQAGNEISGLNSQLDARAAQLQAHKELLGAGIWADDYFAALRERTENGQPPEDDIKTQRKLLLLQLLAALKTTKLAGGEAAGLLEIAGQLIALSGEDDPPGETVKWMHHWKEAFESFPGDDAGYSLRVPRIGEQFDDKSMRTPPGGSQNVISVRNWTIYHKNLVRTKAEVIC